MSTLTEKKFSLVDLIPESEALVNSNLATECPFCHSEALKCWFFPPVTYPMVYCEECHFLGNAVHVKSRLEKTPYTILAPSYKNHDKDIDDSRNIDSQVKKLFRKISKYKKYKKDYFNEASYHFKQKMGVRPHEAKALYRHTGFVPNQFSTRNETIIIPMFLRGNIPVRWNSIPKMNMPSDNLQLASRNNNNPKGWLDLSNGGDSVLIVRDHEKLAKLTALYQISSNNEEVAPFLYNTGAWAASHVAMGEREKIVATTDNLPARFLYFLYTLPNVRFSFESTEELGDRLEFGSKGFIDSLYEDSYNFSDFVCKVVRDGHEKIIEDIKNTDIPKEDLYAIYSSGNTGLRKKIEKVWPEMHHGRIKNVSGRIYKQIPEGGYLEYEHNWGDNKDQDKEVANVHQLVEERIICGNRLLNRGWIVHNGMETYGEIARKHQSYMVKEFVLDCIALKNMKSTPDFEMSAAKWMHINSAFSTPKTYKGHEECGYYPETGIVLPGVTIDEDSVRNIGLVAKMGHNFLTHGSMNTRGILEEKPEQDIMLLSGTAIGLYITNMVFNLGHTHTTFVSENENSIELCKKVLKKFGVGQHCHNYLQSGIGDKIRFSESTAWKPVDTMTAISLPATDKRIDKIRVPDGVEAIVWNTLKHGLNAGPEREKRTYMNFWQWMQNMLKEKGIFYDVSRLTKYIFD